MIAIVNNFLSNFLARLIDYLPSFFGGLIILIIGIVLASLLKRILISLLSFFKLSYVLQRTRLMNKSEVRVWEEVLAEVLRWTVVILFLIPTLEVWGLSRATAVINQFLFYLPNVIVAVVIGFVGLLASNLVSDVVKQSFAAMGAGSANTLSALSKWVIVFFAALVVLNQLGVAQDLIRILLTGIVAMLALAGGLAFGLGGRDMAKDILEQMKSKLK
ncbi:MAG: hypothetical protein HYW86_03150 [Candidatus Roizmanbacteria bacterium]|nr:MAG: hypothetical protein HYW86_03150 [Candidatus Roizmanbacteria bacterium]